MTGAEKYFEKQMSDPEYRAAYLRAALVEALSPFERFLASDGHYSLRSRSAEELADAAIKVFEGLQDLPQPGEPTMNLIHPEVRGL